jgi:hypothetical protein
MRTARLKARVDFGRPYAAAIDDAWQRESTRAAIEGCRAIIKKGIIPHGTAVGRLGDTEWGWLVTAVLFGWISTRAQQAVAEQIDIEQAVRITGLDPLGRRRCRFDFARPSRNVRHRSESTARTMG